MFHKTLRYRAKRTSMLDKQNSKCVLSNACTFGWGSSDYGMSSSERFLLRTIPK